jgi:hypothetical protein
MLPAARMHLGMGLLEQGRFQEAWMHYEFRWDTADRVNDQRPYTCPRWEGEKVKTLAIHGEQGLGDEILFMSLFREAQKRAARVVVECAGRLAPASNTVRHSLLSGPCQPDAAVEGKNLTPISRWARSPGSGDARRQALHAPPSPRAPRTKPLIGIAWRGGTVRTNFSDRTLKLSDLKRILRMTDDFDFVSVQYGGDEVAEEADAAGPAAWPSRFRQPACPDRPVRSCHHGLPDRAAPGRRHGRALLGPDAAEGPLGVLHRP